MASVDDNVPIALRKGKRSSDLLSSPIRPRAVSANMATQTPSTRRTKRVRFSDPGLFSPNATSLTPAFRRSSLATPKQRRPVTPGRPAIEGNVQFAPFTQTLDERCQRRIRRNGLSEELNNYESEKRSRAALQKELNDKEAELQRLRQEVVETRSGHPQFASSYEPPPSSQVRAKAIEAELESLRQSFSAAADSPTFPPAEWNTMPELPGPDSDSGDTIPIFEDDNADSFPASHRQPSQEIRAEATVMGIELQAAKEAKSSFLESFRDQAVNTSFDFDFADSPARSQQLSQSVDRIPETQLSFIDVKKQLSEASSRAEEAELALTALDIEISELGFGDVNDDTLSMVAAISAHFRTARLELERLIPGETASGFAPSQILPEILSKTKLLSDRLKIKESDLKAARDQHRNLKNNFEKAIVAAEKANDRVKQLEATIDSSSEDTLFIRMRAQELEKDVHEKEKDIASLSTALNKYRNDITRLETLINNLQSEYEAAARSNEDLETRLATETTGRRAAEVSAVQRLARINELENTLASTRRQITDLEARLTTTDTPTEEVASLNDRISNLANALVTANAEVDRLRATKARLEERVRAEAEQGAKAVETLQEQLIRTVMRGNEAKKRYVNGAKVRIANWELTEDISSDGVTYVEQSSPSSRRSSVKFAEYAEVEVFERDEQGSQEAIASVEEGEIEGAEDSGSESVPGSVEVYRGRGKYRKTPKLVTYDQARRVKKRKYDSGVGLDSDFEIYDESQEHGLMTPELSSDGGEALEEMEMVV